MKRTTSILLLMAMLAAVSCGDSVATDDTTASTPDTTTAAETDALDARNSIDDELGDHDFGGYEFRIVTCDSNTASYFLEESTGDVVDDAIYARNRAVEERFNCKISVVGDFNSREPNNITNSISANEDSFDLVCWAILRLGGIATGGYFLNWHEIPNIDFDKPWWSDSNVTDLTSGGVALMAIGDLTLSAIEKTYCVFYNKELGGNYSLPDMYSIVDEGKWTIDYLIGTTKDIYEDLNGNNEIDNEDLFGYTSDCQSNVNAYLWAFDNQIMRKNGDTMEFSLNLEKTADIIDKVISAFTVNNGIRMDTKYVNGNINLHWYGVDMFSFGRSVFSNGFIGQSLSKLRDLEDEFAILPYPKWDENQKDYYTMVDGGHQAMAVPVTISDDERTGVIVEALCAESYKKVVPAYYDVALKVKGTRDEKSVEMLDRIMEGRVFDFGYAYDNWKGVSFFMQELIVSNKPNFASYWASKESAVMKHYNSVIEYFENYGA